jgi:hypothetical protein
METKSLRRIVGGLSVGRAVGLSDVHVVGPSDGLAGGVSLWEVGFYHPHRFVLPYAYDPN